MKPVIPIDDLETRIFVIRNQKVMVDSDLARLYGITTKRLNQQVNRNPRRFPDDFMFTLSQQEKLEVVANCNRLECSQNMGHSCWPAF